jgi:SPP1 family predicted phage head-tail adaptor
MTYTAQELNTKIQLQHVTYTRDDYGDQTESWVTYAEAFCRFEPLLGREFFAAQQSVSEAQAKITLRWRDGIDASDRIVARGESWDIVSIQNIAYRNRELLIYLKRNPVANA